jgi:hypothetical protein
MDVSAVADNVRVIIRSLWGAGSTLAREAMQPRRLLPSLHVLSVRLSEGRICEVPEADLTNLAILYSAQGNTPFKLCIPRCDNADELWLRRMFSNVEVGTKMWGKIDSGTH